MLNCLLNYKDKGNTDLKNKDLCLDKYCKNKIKY